MRTYANRVFGAHPHSAPNAPNEPAAPTPVVANVIAISAAACLAAQTDLNSIVVLIIDKWEIQKLNITILVSLPYLFTR